MPGLLGENWEVKEKKWSLKILPTRWKNEGDTDNQRIITDQYIGADIRARKAQRREGRIKEI